MKAAFARERSIPMSTPPGSRPNSADLVPRPLLPHLRLEPPPPHARARALGSLFGCGLGGLVMWGALIESATLAATPLVAYASMVAVMGARVVGRTRALRHKLLRGLELQAVGELERAADYFERMAREDADPHGRRVAIAMLAETRLYQGNYDEALALFREVSRSSYPNDRLLPVIDLAIAEVLVLTDRPGEAQAYLRQPSPDTRHSTSAFAVVYARLGAFDAVARLEQAPAPGWLRPFLGTNRRVYWLMQAYARDRLGHPEEAALFQRARPAYAGELEFLMPMWPELRAYIAARRWDPVAVADGAELPRARLVARASVAR
jgi:tetratricopeptide (TPR) repeat protein